MTDQINDQISAFIDNELSADESALLVRRFERDPEARARAMRYTLIGASLRGELLEPHPSVLRQRVAAAALSAALRRATPKIREQRWAERLARPLLGVGIAATVAVVAIGTLRSLNEAAFAPGGATPLAAIAAAGERLRRCAELRRAAGHRPDRAPVATDPAHELPHAPRRVRFGLDADVRELERRRRRRWSPSRPMRPRSRNPSSPSRGWSKRCRAAHPVAAPSLLSARVARRPRDGAGGARLARAHEPRRRRAQLPRHVRARARRHRRRRCTSCIATRTVRAASAFCPWMESGREIVRQGDERSGNFSGSAHRVVRDAQRREPARLRVAEQHGRARAALRDHARRQRARRRARRAGARDQAARRVSLRLHVVARPRDRDAAAVAAHRRAGSRSSSRFCSRRSRFRPTSRRPRSKRRSIPRASRPCALPESAPLAAEIPWRAATVPGGFKLSVATQSPIAGSDTPVEHLVYSDGLATVSVFIEDPGDQGRGR